MRSSLTEALLCFNVSTRAVQSYLLYLSTALQTFKPRGWLQLGPRRWQPFSLSAQCIGLEAMGTTGWHTAVVNGQVCCLHIFSLFFPLFPV